MMRIYLKYILKELVQPFIFGIGAFTAIFIGTDILFKLAEFYSNFEISILTTFELFLLSLPQIIVYTFPMATLLATILAYSRLNGDSEITAFRAGGFSLKKLIIPALIVGLLASFGGIAINELVVPEANYRYSQIVYEFQNGGEERPRSQYDLFLTPLDSATNRPDFILYTRRFDADAGKMEIVNLQEYEDGRPSRLIEADSAIWQEAGWHFYDGRIYHLSAGDRVARMDFSEYIVRAEIESPERIAELDRDTDEMTLWELSEYISAMRSQGRDVFAERVFWHQKISVPFASFIFALMAAPLGMKPKRQGGSSSGMGLSVIIIFIYYGLMTLGDAMGSQGAMPPWLGAWLQNLVFAGVGSVLLYKTGR